MGDFIFNIAKGKPAYYNGQAGTGNAALIMVLLKSSGLEADDTLNNYIDLATLLAAANDEADFTNYARKTITSTTRAQDDTNNRVDLDTADLTWTSAGGATNNTLGAALLCYDADTTGGTDSSVIPVAKFDFSATTDGTDLTLQFNASGWGRAA